MHKLDLHTHSTASPDGGIRAHQYKQALREGLIDYVAVTDHNRVDFATRLREELGDKVIVGEEIMTTSGEIIGLFLQSLISPGLSVLETIKQIKQQNGLVYIPHPFETVRKGISLEDLDKISKQVDIVEVFNGRALLQNRSQQATAWSKSSHVAGAASSDAHGIKGIGASFVSIKAPPTRENLVNLLNQGQLTTGRPNVASLLYPKYNRLRNKLRGAKR